MTHGHGRQHARRLSRHAVSFGSAAAVIGAVIFFGAPQANASIDTSSGAQGLANALSTGDTLTGSFVTTPTPFSGHVPYGVSTTPLAGFPTAGDSFGILTTGDVASVTTARDASGTTTTSYSAAYNAKWADTPPTQLWDVSILKLDFATPAGANCLSFDFRFLSEEYPNTSPHFDDAFIAELDNDSWQGFAAGTGVSAPANFAFDANGDPINVDSPGLFTQGPANTEFDGATTILTASTPVESGSHSLYLSVLDYGDDARDSGVFFDNLTFGHVANTGLQCLPGAAVKSDAALTLASDGDHELGTSATVTSTFTSGGSPFAGMDVYYFVNGTPADAPGSSGVDGTNDYSYQGAAVGTDEVIACADVNASGDCDAGDVSASVEVAWTEPPSPSPSPTALASDPGGVFGLAPTGTVAGVIAGVGVVVVAAGVGLVLLGRRRKATASE